MGKKKKFKLSPPPIKWRTLIKISFLILCLMWTLGFIRTYTINDQSNAEVIPKTIETKEENPAVSVGAQTFATNFVETYYTWNIDKLQERSNNLEVYLRPGLDKDAGLRYDGLEGSSKPSEIEIINIEDEKDEEKSISTITFHISHYLEKKGEKDKVKKSGPFHKYIKVQVLAKDGGYVVNEIPTLTSEPLKPEIEDQKNEDRTLSDKVDQSSVGEFLSTFLKVYTSGTNQELEYYTDNLKLSPLSGDITFKEVESFKAYDGEGESYDLEVNATFQDEVTKGTILQKYEMNVIQKEGRWIVKKLK